MLASYLSHSYKLPRNFPRVSDEKPQAFVSVHSPYSLDIAVMSLLQPQPSPTSLCWLHHHLFPLMAPSGVTQGQSSLLRLFITIAVLCLLHFLSDITFELIFLLFKDLLLSEINKQVKLI